MRMAFHSNQAQEVTPVPAPLSTSEQGMITSSSNKHSENSTPSSLFHAGQPSMSSLTARNPRKFSPRRSAVDPEFSRKFYRAPKASGLWSSSKTSPFPISSHPTQLGIASQNDNKSQYLATDNLISHSAVFRTTVNSSGSAVSPSLFHSGRVTPHLATNATVAPNLSKRNPLENRPLISSPLHIPRTTSPRAKTSAGLSIAPTENETLPTSVRLTQPNAIICAATEVPGFEPNDSLENRKLLSTFLPSAQKVISYSPTGADSVSATSKAKKVLNPLPSFANSNPLHTQPDVTAKRSQTHSLEIGSFIQPHIISTEKAEKLSYANAALVAASVIRMESEGVLQSRGTSTGVSVPDMISSTRFSSENDTASQTPGTSTQPAVSLTSPVSNAIGQWKKIESSARSRDSITIENTALTSKQICSVDKLVASLPFLSISQLAIPISGAPVSAEASSSNPLNSFFALRKRKYHRPSIPRSSLIATRRSAFERHGFRSSHSQSTSMRLRSSRATRAPNLSPENPWDAHCSVDPDLHPNQVPQRGETSTFLCTTDKLWDDGRALKPSPRPIRTAWQIGSPAWKQERNRIRERRGFLQPHIDLAQVAIWTETPVEAYRSRNSLRSNPFIGQSNHLTQPSVPFSSAAVGLVSGPRNSSENLGKLSPFHQTRKDLSSPTIPTACTHAPSSPSENLRLFPPLPDSMSACIKPGNQTFPSSPFLDCGTSPRENQLLLLPKPPSSLTELPCASAPVPQVPARIFFMDKNGVSQTTFNLKQRATPRSATSEAGSSTEINHYRIERSLKPSVQTTNLFATSRTIPRTPGPSARFNPFDDIIFDQATPHPSNPWRPPATAALLNRLEKIFENQRTPQLPFQSRHAETLPSNATSSRPYTLRSVDTVKRRRSRLPFHSPTRTILHQALATKPPTFVRDNPFECFRYPTKGCRMHDETTKTASCHRHRTSSRIYAHAIRSDDGKVSQIPFHSKASITFESSCLKSTTPASLLGQNVRVARKVRSRDKSRADWLRYRPYVSMQPILHVPNDIKGKPSLVFPQPTTIATAEPRSERKSHDLRPFQPPFNSSRPFMIPSAEGSVNDKADRSSCSHNPTKNALQKFSFSKTSKDLLSFQTRLQPTKTVLSPRAGFKFDTCVSVPHSAVNVAWKSGPGNNCEHRGRSQPSLPATKSNILGCSVLNAGPCIPCNPFEDQYGFQFQMKKAFPNIGDRIKIFKSDPRVTRRAKVIRQVDDTNFLLSYSDYTLDRKTELQVETIGVFHNETVCLQRLRWSLDNGLPKRRRSTRSVLK